MARQLKIDVVVDSAGAVRALGQVEDKLGGVESAASRASRSFSAFGDRATRIGAGLSAGVTLPIVAAGSALLAAGVNARESEDLFAVAFGNMADQARQWSEATSDAMGSSAFLFREQAATLFTMTQSMGQSREAAFEMATGFVALGRDLESFFNLAEGEGFAKLRSGLTGEIEPLKQLGIVFNAAEVEARVFALGLAEVADEITEADKVAARYSLITERASAAQGNAALTAESEANQLRALKAEFGDSARELGQALLPMLSDLLVVFRDMIPLVRGAVDWFTSLSPTMQKVIVGGTALAAALGPVLLGFGAVATAIGTALPIIGSIAAAIGALATGPVIAIGAALAALAVIWIKWGDDIKAVTIETVTRIREWLVDKFGAIVDSVQNKIEAVTGFFRRMKDAVVGNSFVPEMIGGIELEFGRLEDVMVSPTQAATDAVAGLFQGLTSRVSGVLGSFFGGGGSGQGGFMGAIMSGGMSIATSLMSGGMDMMVNFASMGMQALSGLFQRGIGALGGAIGSFFQNLFGGPSEAELQGREAYASYRDAVVEGLNEGQIQEAVAAGWANPDDAALFIEIRDTFLATGRTIQEAQDFYNELIGAIEEGPDAVQAMIDQIEAMRREIAASRSEADALNRTLGSASVNTPGGAGGAGFALGGLVQAFPDGGLARGIGDHVPALVQPGEFVMRRSAVNRIGVGALRSMNAGGSAGGINVNISGVIMDSPTAGRRLAKLVSEHLGRDIQMRRAIV